MDERVKKIDTVKKCEIFARNARDLDREDLAKQADARAVEISADAHNAQSEVERECLQAVYAYEAAQSRLKGRTFRATRTWQMIQRHGIIKAVERAVDRVDETMGYQTLVDMGMGEFAFERVILRHSEKFSGGAVSRSRERVGNDRTDT